jgi:hypothetical protein
MPTEAGREVDVPGTGTSAEGASVASRSYEAQIEALVAEKAAAERSSEAAASRLAALEAEKDALVKQVAQLEKVIAATNLASSKYGAKLAQLISDRTIRVDSIPAEEIEAYIDQLGERIAGMTRSVSWSAADNPFRANTRIPGTTASVHGSLSESFSERMRASLSSRELSQVKTGARRAADSAPGKEKTSGLLATYDGYRPVTRTPKHRSFARRLAAVLRRKPSNRPSEPDSGQP